MAAFQQAIRVKQPRRDPDLSVVAHCVAEALALTPSELAEVTAGARAGIASGKFKVPVPYDVSGVIDEKRLPPMPKLPTTSAHPKREGDGVSERRVTRLVTTFGSLTPKERVLVTQGVREGLAARAKGG